MLQGSEGIAEGALRRNRGTEETGRGGGEKSRLEPLLVVELAPAGQEGGTDQRGARGKGGRAVYIDRIRFSSQVDRTGRCRRCGTGPTGDNQQERKEDQAEAENGQTVRPSAPGSIRSRMTSE